MAHANFAFVELGVPLKMLTHGAGRPLQVIGVGHTVPGLNTQWFQLGQRVPDHGGPSLVEAPLAGLHIPLPGAHIGTFQDALQALSFLGQGLSGTLGTRHGPFVVADVDAKAHDVAVGHTTLHNPHPVITRYPLLQRHIAAAMGPHALSHPLVDATVGYRVLSPFRAMANNAFKSGARDNQVGRLFVQLPVFFIAKNQPVLRVIQHEGFIHSIDGSAQQGLAVLGLQKQFFLQGYVLESPHQTNGPTVIKLRLTDQPHPAQGSIRPIQLQGQIPALAHFYGFFSRSDDTRTILWRIKGHGLVQSGAVIRIHAMNHAGLVRPFENPCFQIQFPSAQTSQPTRPVQEGLHVA